MSFMDYVPCQIAGKEYLEKIANKYPWKKIRVGGHSKGGNVAIHNITEEEKKNITKMLKLFVKGYISVFKEAKTGKLELMKKHYINKGKKFIEERKNHHKKVGGNIMTNNISVIAQSAIRIVDKNGKTIYFDPFRINREYSKDADIIFITHPHFDHFSPEDIMQIKKDDTKIVAPKELEDQIQELGITQENILLVMPDEDYMIDGIEFETIPAYNTNKSFHKRKYNWVGYIVTIDDKRIYVAGDTDNIEEARNLKCELAFVPIGGTYTMTYKEAVELIKEMKPNLAIPIHYKTIVGSTQDAIRFKEELQGIVDVEILMK